MLRCAYGLLLLLVGSISALEAKIEAKMAAKKVAAVIGYGPGIGHSCAALWASKGYAVALVSRTASKLETATSQIPGSAAFPCDITDNAALKTTMTAISNQLGPVDTLLYNAGNGVWKKFDEARFRVQNHVDTASSARWRRRRATKTHSSAYADYGGTIRHGYENERLRSTHVRAVLHAGDGRVGRRQHHRHRRNRFLTRHAVRDCEEII